MPVKQLTSSWTEADLESTIHGVLTRAFPWLPEHSIRHQIKFSFAFGRKKIEIDGLEASQAEARADILLYRDDKPLAVLELKRPGTALTSSDDAQGLSYARVLNPSPPLVIVTNGDELHFVETHSGKPWRPTQFNEQAFQNLVMSAARVAAADMKLAIATLMGTNSAVWQQAVRHTSTDMMTELSASWDKPAMPFVRDFMIPRKAAAQILKLATSDIRLILVEGAPMTGKSNVLREVILRTIQHPNIATLYIEGGVGRGILQNLADALASSLAWPVSQEEARNWLIHVSQTDDGHKLLLAIDGLDIDNRETRKEIEDLSSRIFHNGLVIIVALDDTVAEQLVSTPNGRSVSAIGRRAQRIRVEPLDAREFQIAQIVFNQRRINFVHGAYASPEFRQPWVLRAITAPLLEPIEQMTADFSAVIPPLLGLNLLMLARKRFTDEKTRRYFKAIATALLIDAKDQRRDPSMVLESCEVNFVRRKILKDYLEETELQWLIDHGFLRPAMHVSGEPVLYVRLPELLASEVAFLLADELIPLAKADHRDAAAWISSAASNLPIGDVIAAQAILDAVQRNDGLPFGLIKALLETVPKRESISPSSRMATHIPGVGIVELVFNKDGSAVVEIDGQLHVIDLGKDELPSTYANIYAWLILSHLASTSLTMETADNKEERIDPQILLEIGTADIILRKPGGDQEMRSMPIHDLSGIGSIVCHKAGIVEPITWSIFNYLKNEGAQASYWIDQAIARKSLPLIARIHIALLELSSLADENISAWARNILENKIAPAFKKFPRLHGEEV